MHSTFNLLISLLPSGLFALLAAGSPTYPTSLANVRQTFEEFKIPENAHLIFNPIALFEVTFPEPAGTTPIHVTTPGSQLPQNAGPPQFVLHCEGIPTTTTNASAVSTNISSSSPGIGPFVIVAVDLDAPTPQEPTLAQFLHFLSGGFYFDTSQYGQRRTRSLSLVNMNLVNNTPAIAEFFQPQPPPGSDPHRYVFLVYDEPPDFSHQTVVNSSTSRLSFNVSAFAATTGLGDPLGGTFILVGPGPSAAT